MAEDREVLREVWDGHIPVCLTLSQEEVVLMQRPDPYYVMLPRVSYFPLVIDKVTKHFLRFVAETDQNTANMWLDFDGQPIKWHYPVGLLWDLLGVDSSLPWNLTVHFKNFPESELVRCNSRPAIESIFMSTIKEADTLKHRGQVMGGMQKKDHNQLWLGLQNDKFDQFWAINRKLMDHGADNKPFRYIPIRIHRPDEPFLQMLVEPTKDSGEPTTLGDLLKRVFPETEPGAESKATVSASGLRVLVHGVEPPHETPLQWLSEHMSYPDNFLHICAHRRDSNT
jgi:autophagy-related protein 5